MKSRSLPAIHAFYIVSYPSQIIQSTRVQHQPKNPASDRTTKKQPPEQRRKSWFTDSYTARAKFKRLNEREGSKVAHFRNEVVTLQHCAHVSWRSLFRRDGHVIGKALKGFGFCI